MDYTEQTHEPPLRKYLEEERPQYVCEWGPGKSTEIILSYDFVKTLVSVEHHPKYSKIAKERFQDERLFLFYVPEEELYVDCPRVVSVSQGIQFRLILVDGQQRMICLSAARNIIYHLGTVILHDAQLPQYMEGINKYSEQEWDKISGPEYTVALKV